MFLNLIRNYFLEKKIPSLPSSKKDCRFEEIQRVGLVVDSQNVDTATFDSLLTSLEKNLPSKTNFQIISYYDKSKDAKNSMRGLGICKSDFTLLGNIKSQDLSYFLEQEFDLLINYYEINDPVLHYITKHARANFKLGMSKSIINEVDLSIVVNTDEPLLFVHEVTKYLKLIKN
jgi:hypothetical protein